MRHEEPHQMYAVANDCCLCLTAVCVGAVRLSCYSAFLSSLRSLPQDFSNWPTIPQLYLGGEFIGGADIVIELYQSGELQEMIEVAAAS